MRNILVVVIVDIWFDRGLLGDLGRCFSRLYVHLSEKNCDAESQDQLSL